MQNIHTNAITEKIQLKKCEFENVLKTNEIG